MARKRIIVGISGATGIVYAERALVRLRTLGVETHLVVSRPGLAPFQVINPAGAISFKTTRVQRSGTPLLLRSDGG